jgi:hypothetical protein
MHIPRWHEFINSVLGCIALLAGHEISVHLFTPQTSQVLHFLVSGFTHGVWLGLADNETTFRNSVSVPSSGSIVMIVNDWVLEFCSH